MHVALFLVLFTLSLLLRRIYVSSNQQLQDGVAEGMAVNGSVYYHWNDGVGDEGMKMLGIDYDRLCHIIVKRVKSSSYNYTILNDGLWGGLGHKHVSLMFSITYAIYLQRNFRSDFLPSS